MLPLLRQLGRGDLAERIAAEHGQMQAAYEAIRPGLEALRDQGLLPDSGAWPAFAALYRAHIALEEGEAYPVTRAAQSTPQRDAMGREMAARRGVAIDIVRTG